MQNTIAVCLWIGFQTKTALVQGSKNIIQSIEQFLSVLRMRYIMSLSQPNPSSKSADSANPSMGIVRGRNRSRNRNFLYLHHDWFYYRGRLTTHTREHAGSD